MSGCCVGWLSVGTGGSKCGCGKNWEGGGGNERGAQGGGRKSEPAPPAGAGPVEGSDAGTSVERIDALAARAFEEGAGAAHLLAQCPAEETAKGMGLPAGSCREGC